MAKLQFDAAGVDMSKDAFAPLPAGDYEVEVTQTDVRATKTGTGNYLWLELTVRNGKFKGRKLFEQINLQNPNPQAVEIAQRTLAGLLAAMGKTKIENDSNELLLHPVIAVVALDKKDATRNRVTRYKAVPTYAPAAPAAAAPAAPAAPAPQGGAADGIPSAW